MTRTEEDLRGWIASSLARRLGLAPHDVDPRERFTRYGLDSLGAVGLVAELSEMLGRRLSPVLIWQHPTPEALARALVEAPKKTPERARAESEPTDGAIAIVGIACRFPNAPDPQSYWRLLRDGEDAITEAPRARWGDGAERFRGGFLEQVDGFDPAFFGIVPREVPTMDPQQRLLLELSWEALEDAGIVPSTLKGSATGVFFGSIWDDYALLAYQRTLTAHTVTGHHRSILANRVSYTLDLQGPSMTVDSACSSALVTVQLACESLRRGESTLALAGGVNLNLVPQSALAVAEMGALSPDGRCFTFDARANGYVRGEGGGVVVLKRVADALRDGDAIYCVVRGSAVNNNGAGNGLTAPSPEAQESLLRQAYARAGIEPEQVDYVELHGTGTALGDPIEATALGAVLGKSRAAERPLRVGSAKTNVGHLEGAAGVVGLLKVVLALHHGQLPPSLHFEKANPLIALDELHLQVQRTLEPWPDVGRPLVAGVSSFGLGGTNAHVVLSQWLPAPVQILPLSAESPEALRHEAERWLAAGEARSDGESWTHRLAVTARSDAELAHRLRAFLEAGRDVGVSVGRASRTPARVAFVFAGQGAQWWGMGRGLLQREPVFRATLEVCSHWIEREQGWSLIDEMTVDRARSRLDRIEVSLPAIIATEIAVAAQWRAWGVEPAVVVGQSTGEIAAAHVAGVLSLEDTMRTICAYGRIIARQRGQGAMGVVGLSWEDAGAELAKHPARLFRAIQHSADSTVLAGDPEALQALFEALEPRKVFCRRVAMDVSPHSPLVDGMRAELFEALRSVRPRKGHIPIVSEVTGAWLEGEHFDAEHWVRNFGDPALFSTALDRLIDEGYDLFVETSPHPLLVPAIESNLRRAGRRGIALASLRRDEDEHHVMLDTLGALYARGASVTWESLARWTRSSPPVRTSPEPLVFAVSAKGEAALEAQAARLGEHLDARPELELRDLAYSLAMARSHLEHRAAIVARDRAELGDALASLAEGRSAPNLVVARSARPGKVVFVFPGQGSQWQGMARALLASSPVFRAQLCQCADALAPHLDGVDLLAVLRGDEGAASLDRVDVVQPALFAMMVALAALWRSMGVEPDAVVGHSQGEIAAAFVAGALSLDEAAKVVALRSRALATVAGGGGMAAIELGVDELGPYLAAFDDRLSIAATNSARSTLVSGDAAAIDALLERLGAAEIFARKIRVDYASHSSQMESVRAAIEGALRDIAPRACAIPFYSTVTGAPIEDGELGAAYWYRNLRQTVRFAEATERLVADGHRFFVEVSPHPVLTLALSQLESAGVVGSLRRDAGDMDHFLRSLAELHARGLPLDWSRVVPRGRRVRLPTYAFQRERFWLESPRTVAFANGLGSAERHWLHGERRPSPGTEVLFVAPVGLEPHAYLGEHRVFGEVVAPGAFHLAALISAAEEAFGSTPIAFEHVELPCSLALAPTDTAWLHLVFSPDRTGVECTFSSSTFDAKEAGWHAHARGVLRLECPEAFGEGLAEVRARCVGSMDPSALYEQLRAREISLGASFRRIESLAGSEGEVLAQLRVESEVQGALHPTELDACLQTLAAASPAAGGPFVPFAIERLAFHGRGSGPAFCHARLRSANDRDCVGDLRVFDGAGRVVAELEGLHLKRASKEAMLGGRSAHARWAYEVSWTKQARTKPAADAGSWVIGGADENVGRALAAALSAKGARILAEQDWPSARAIVLVCTDDAMGEPQEQAYEKVLGWVKALSGVASRNVPRLYIVTRATQQVAPDERVHPAMAILWGMGRTVRYEHAELACTLVDLAAGGADDEAAQLADELLASTREDEISLRSSGRYVGRLTACAAANVPARSVAVRSDATYLVTGGLGALGRRAAAWLVAQGARSIVLAGRSAAPEPTEAMAHLEAQGARVAFVQTDVGDAEQVERLLRHIEADLPPLRGVVHAAGLLDDALLAGQDLARYRKVARPKVWGAHHLDRLTRGKGLDFFVVYSSVASVLGSPGQANYAAANAYLDALARQRRVEGEAGLSIDWGAFAEEGLAAAHENRGARLSARGIRSFSPEEGVALLEAALAQPSPQIAWMDIDGRQWVEFYPQLAHSPRLSPVLKARRSPSKGLPAAERPANLQLFVREHVASVTRLDASAIAADVPLTTLGLDSLLGLELRNRFEAALGLVLPATLIWTYPSIAALSGYLTASLQEGSAPSSPVVREDVARTGGAEPIAIVGMACRFPGGADDPASFWRLLEEGVDAVTEIPASRWPAGSRPRSHGAPGTQWAALLDSVDGFDADFFGISPREAAGIDPQHRLLLELTWEALEDAHVVPEQLVGSRTGVFVGVMGQDYNLRTLARPASELDVYSSTGNGSSFAAGRISYVFGLQGPCLAVDTACSSSLVAVHLACQSLRNGESRLALAAGVNLILSPLSMEIVARTQALSPDGRCRAFDARANGFVRGEGGGVLVLERLSDAQAAGHPIWAVIRGSATNQDGRSTGLTAPNVLSQQELLSQALQSAGLEGHDVGYIEAHGTGTSLGDPIEFEALKTVLGRPRANGTTCALGSVKTNLGHLEAAAGIAGLIKSVLALEHELVPRHLHFETLNPRMSLEGTPFVIPAEARPWSKTVRPRVAGVSSFGLSGVNAHVLIEEASAVPLAPSEESASCLLPLSAKSPAALSALVRAYAAHLTGPNPPSLKDVCYTAGTRRTHHAHRLAVVACSSAEMVERLAGLARGESRPHCSQGARRIDGDCVFVFPGQGSQWVGMGRGLLEREPAFRTALEACDAALRPWTDWGLLEALASPELPELLERVEYVQPMLFAMQVALAAQWRAWGIAPKAVVGHSMGEVAAAHVAGALSLEDAAAIIAVRSAAVATMQGQGGMALVELPRDEAERRLHGLEARLAVAAHNGPRTCLLSGALGDLEPLLAQLEREGVFCRRVKVTYASHSPQMDALAAGLRARLAKLAPAAVNVPMLSTVTGEWVQGTDLDTEYWIRNLREPVRFWGAAQRLEREGHCIFLEVSAHPVLVPSLEDGFAGQARAVAAFPTLRRDEDERASMLATLGALYTSGQSLPFARWAEPGASPVRGLPRYPWQRERFWIDEHAVPSAEVRDGHPLLGAHLEASRAKHYFSAEIVATRPAYLADHRAADAVVFPGAGYVEMALAGARRIFGLSHAIDEVHFETMLVLGEKPVAVQLAIDAERMAFEIFSRADGAWTLHARGMLKAQGSVSETVPTASLEAIRARCTEVVTPASHYQGLRKLGLDYGPAFQGVCEVHRGADEALGRVRIPEMLDAELAAYDMHPALLDACLQVAGNLMSAEGNQERRALPVAARSVRVLGALRGELWCHAVRTSPTSARMDVYDGSGSRVLEVGSFEVRFLERPRSEPFYGVEWSLQLLSPARAEGRALWILLVDADVGAPLAARLDAAGQRVACISPAEFDLDDAAALERTLREIFAAADAPCRGIVHLGALLVPELLTPTTLREAQRRGYESALALVQALARIGLRDAPRLWLVTGGAQSVLPGQRNEGLAMAPIWGLGRTISHEMPELRCSCVDVSVSPDAQELDALANELLNEEGREDQLGLRGPHRFVARLTRGVPSHPVPWAEHSYRMQTPKPGVLDDIGFCAAPRRDALAEGEVELEVSAAGLNFLDVLAALGAIGDLDGAGGIALGFECAGRIARVGPGVSGLHPGQEVLAIAPGAFASHVVTAASLVVPKPAAMRLEEAAAIPVAFMTAVHALEDVARLRSGERVLIHAAAGGVGMAAVQVAQSLGAEIFATAGSEEKRALLRSLGIEHVMDSRSLAFADDVLARTNGEGVDVVLNSLGGAFIAKSLGVLRNYGRFVEIGKRDYFDDQPLGLRPFLKKLTFSLVDLRGMTRERPDIVQRLFRDVVARFESGALRVPPLRVYPAAQAVEAFRFMAQGGHTGKIVFSFAPADAPATVLPSVEAPIRPDGTYLVTGGLGGVGLELAGALASRGARHLVLAGRRAPGPEAVARVDALRASGVTVETAQLDVADAAQVAALVSRMGADLPLLRGVVHAAAVLADATLLRTTAESCRIVAAPKILGAWNLHVLTEGQPLDFFVLCSSVASVLGSPGQGNYSAANAFLDALAHHRRGLGLPAVSIDFGPWAEVGLAAATAERGERIALRGIESFSPAEGADVFLRLLEPSSAQVAAMRFHVRQWTESYLSAARSPLLSELARHESAPMADVARAFRERVRAMSAHERPMAIERELQQQLGHVLRRAPDAIDPAAPFKSLGVDSLMAIEFRNRLETALGTSLSAALIWQHPTLGALAMHLAAGLDAGPQPPAPEASALPPGPEVSAQGAQRILQALKKLATRASGAKIPESKPQ